MNSFFRKYRKDIMLVAGILVAAGVLYCLCQWKMKPGRVVVVQCEDKIIATYDLEINEESLIKTPYGQNKLCIHEGTASVTEADCPDKLCVHQGRISQTGQNIVCLPHKLVVFIEETGS